ncbi:YibE/F family protein [Sutcliffiella halmapala]|uniref:YibE/F family protein n=1 Tax=Sutcliffiella halmapala TaxID=79882 RepID=UPI000995B844|nr:YibE/F family protein [Sutcliffiella halmapala]
MNVLVLLTIILFILMVLIGGKKGARSFIALFFNFIVLFFTVLFMTDPNANPIILILLACTGISCINLFFINEVNIKTTTAFISTIVVFVILLFFIVMVTESAMIKGFGIEEIDDFSMFSSLYIGIDFMKLAIAVIITSTIGAIVDIAISISSPMREISYHNPNISRKDLFLSGISIGKDILGTSTNTLFFAFFGGYLALLILFKDVSYSFGQIINSKVFVAEMLTILVAGIGVALTIPVTALITAYMLVKKDG